jgi:hypothetical protein
MRYRHIYYGTQIKELRNHIAQLNWILKRYSLGKVKFSANFAKSLEHDLIDLENQLVQLTSNN